MLNLTPKYRAGRLDLKPTTGKGTLAFVKGSAALKLSLTPFFQGEPGPPGPSGAGFVHSEPLPSSVRPSALMITQPTRGLGLVMKSALRASAMARCMGSLEVAGAAESMVMSDDVT